VNYKS